MSIADVAQYIIESMEFTGKISVSVCIILID